MRTFQYFSGPFNTFQDLPRPFRKFPVLSRPLRSSRNSLNVSYPSLPLLNIHYLSEHFKTFEDLSILFRTSQYLSEHFNTFQEAKLFSPCKWIMRLILRAELIIFCAVTGQYSPWRMKLILRNYHHLRIMRGILCN